MISQLEHERRVKVLHAIFKILEAKSQQKPMSSISIQRAFRQTRRIYYRYARRLWE